MTGDSVEQPADPGDVSVLCTIAARGGSTGVPRKNIRRVAGKPLLSHTIEDAKAWDRCTDLVVSTDDEEIATVGEEWGATVPFTRPDRLATDEAAKLPVIQHAHREMVDHTGREYDYVVDLDATAPLRDVTDIENCFREVATTDAKNAYTVTKAHKNPYFNMVELDDNGYAHLSKQTESDVVRRQDTPDVYAMNASVYVWETDALREADSVHTDRTRISEMPPERSVDIDRPVDLAFVEFLLENEGEFL